MKIIESVCRWIVEKSGLNEQVAQMHHEIEELPVKLNPATPHAVEQIAEGLNQYLPITDKGGLPDTGTSRVIGLEMIQELHHRLRELERKGVEVSSSPWRNVDGSAYQPDRPDLEAQKREEENAKLLGKGFGELRAQIKDLDNRLRRSDPIVQRVIAEGPGSMKYDERFVRLNARIAELEGRLQRALPDSTEPYTVDHDGNKLAVGAVDYSKVTRDDSISKSKQLGEEIARNSALPGSADGKAG